MPPLLNYRKMIPLSYVSFQTPKPLGMFSKGLYIGVSLEQHNTTQRLNKRNIVFILIVVTHSFTAYLHFEYEFNTGQKSHRFSAPNLKRI
jgi:hypothetical protein